MRRWAARAASARRAARCSPPSPRASVLYVPFALAAGPGRVWNALVVQSTQDGASWRLPFPDGFHGHGSLPAQVKDFLAWLAPFAALLAVVLAARRPRAAAGPADPRARGDRRTTSRGPTRSMRRRCWWWPAGWRRSRGRASCWRRCSASCCSWGRRTARRRCCGRRSSPCSTSTARRGSGCRPRTPPRCRGSSGSSSGSCRRAADLRRPAPLGSRDVQRSAAALPRAAPERPASRRAPAGPPGGAAEDRRRAPARAAAGGDPLDRAGVGAGGAEPARAAERLARARRVPGAGLPPRGRLRRLRGARAALIASASAACHPGGDARPRAPDRRRPRGRRLAVRAGAGRAGREPAHAPGLRDQGPGRRRRGALPAGHRPAAEPRPPAGPLRGHPAGPGGPSARRCGGAAPRRGRRAARTSRPGRCSPPRRRGWTRRWPPGPARASGRWRRRCRPSVQPRPADPGPSDHGARLPDAVGCGHGLLR